MQLVFEPVGRVRCVYGEAIDVNQIGPLSIRQGRMSNQTDLANGPQTYLP